MSLGLQSTGTWISWAPHCPEVPNAFAELPDRPWLTNTQEGQSCDRSSGALQRKLWPALPAAALQDAPCQLQLLLSSKQALLSALVLFLGSTSSPPVVHKFIGYKANKAPVQEPLPFLPLQMHHLSTG